MNKFSQFSQDEQLFLGSTAYRVGVWISNSDDNKRSKFDDKREEQALEKAIAHMAGLHRKMPFAATVMKFIQEQKSQWGMWEDNTSEAVVLEDTQKAIDLMRSRNLDKELRQYKHAVWQTGLIVAQAYGEHIDPDNEMHVDRFFAWLGSFIFAPKMAKSPENMSAKEKTALKKLRAVLKN
jgi:hypothetical protein